MERQPHLLRRVGVPDGRRDGEAVELALDQRERATLGVAGSAWRSPDGVGGAARIWPSTLTCRSSIVSRSADCVRGGVRFSSSTSTTCGEDRAGPEIPAPGVGHEDRHARDVGREEVGVTLDPREVRAERGGERPGQHRLAHPGHVLNEEMAAREGGHGGGDQRALAAEDDLPRLRTSAWPRATASSRSRTRSSRTLIGFPPCRGPWVSTLRGHGSLPEPGPFGAAWPERSGLATPASIVTPLTRLVAQGAERDGERLRRRWSTPGRSSSGSSRRRACPPRSRRTQAAGCPGRVR